MGKKRDKSIAEEDIEISSESAEDSEEEITFDPMTKEERKKQEQSMHDDNKDDDEDDDEDVDMINVEFEFSDPKEEHFKSIRNFSRYLFLGTAKDVDFSPLADAVVKQVEVGSMVQVSGEDDVYAFLTLLNLQYYKDNQSIKDILSILRKNCPSELKDSFESFLSKPTGLLLNERMRNFPPEVMPHLFESLGEDVKWALENSSTKEAFQYEYLLVIAPCFYEKTEPKRKSKKPKLNAGPDTCLFFHFEDELIKKYAALSFSFDVAQLGDETLSEAIHQSRLVMVVPFSKYPTIVSEVQTLVSE
ncbi:hypothetical protein JH06_4093 [Blastocystis sp. subtype 4]|uniref:hypothetical protein n=1 Tax=Blastocystis sp. subtype 4 TaxID=944170 RepID=UPI000712039B|nr:hypothetical protein JH06_4093 [Blastocystis sp. subtype 4]KNB42497.1 hypothetical protein JH06_4093 [Blastocystis sp. subtype 4]|eukprot:XP_014525940.1 hypothetical protein JH06_4093 [Blastocystis sp. subtype 4]